MMFLATLLDSLGSDVPGLAAVGGALVAALTIGVVFYGMQAAGTRRRVNRRIARVRGEVAAKPMTKTRSVSVRRATGEGGKLGQMFGRMLIRPDRLRLRLMQTGKKATLAHYAVACILTSLVAAGGTTLAFTVPPIAALLAGVTAGVLLPHMVLSFMIGRRTKKFLAQFPDVIDLLVRGLRSGLPISESVRVVSSEFREPAGPEFGRISDAVRFGQPLEEALWDGATRVRVPEFNFLAISVSVQRETGGNLAEALSNLGDILRKRRQMMLKIKALSSEAKASAVILGSLPFVLFGILYVVNPEYVMTLFTDKRGHLMLAFGFASLFTGIGVMAKMVRFEI